MGVSGVPTIVQIPTNVSTIGPPDQAIMSVVHAQDPDDFLSPCAAGGDILYPPVSSLGSLSVDSQGNIGAFPLPMPALSLTCPAGATGAATCTVQPATQQYTINTTVPYGSDATVTWNVNLQLCFNNAPCPLLTIVDTDTNAVVSSGTTPPENLTAGEQVNLQASTQSGTGTITSPQWIIPGNTVKNYILLASTEFSVPDGILAKAELAGANTVMSGAELSVSTRPAFFTAATSVDSTGLLAAAVATWRTPAWRSSCRPPRC